MALSYTMFFIAYSLTMLVGLFAGVLLTVGWKDMSWRKALMSAKYNTVYIVIIAAFPLFILVQGMLDIRSTDPHEHTNEVVYTHWIFSLAGGAIRILQDRLDYQIFIDFFSIIYVWLFTFLVYFAPLLLLSVDDRANLRKYAIAMMINYLILLPFYAFFPVTVSGSNPDSGITPSLYIDQNWGRLVTNVDPLNNDFPSAHVSLTVTALLIFAYARREYARVYYFLIFATGAIVFAVLYLGVHWPADVFGGFIVGVVAVMAANSEKIQMTIDRYARAVNNRIFKDETAGEISSSPASRK